MCQDQSVEGGQGAVRIGCLGDTTLIRRWFSLCSGTNRQQQIAHRRRRRGGRLKGYRSMAHKYAMSVPNTEIGRTMQKYCNALDAAIANIDMALKFKIDHET
jgi:hypothetical protein